MICKLIADAGSTKTDWVLTGAEGREMLRLQTTGINALTASDRDIARYISEVTDRLPSGCEVKRVRYYGAGCATPDCTRRIVTLLHSATGATDITVDSDMLGAARSLLSDRRGIACILGTGSNSALCDKGVITSSTPSLGYILGDEGSGSVLGRNLLADAFKGAMPAALRDALLATPGLTKESLLENVYRGSAPARYLASFVPFIRDNIDDPYLDSLVRSEFRRFLERNVAHYDKFRELQVCFTGGIATAFEPQLRQECELAGYTVGSIVSRPIDGLVAYHANFD